MICSRVHADSTIPVSFVHYVGEGGYGGFILSAKMHVKVRSLFQEESRTRVHECR